MKTRIITVCLLFMHLLFAGCSKEEAIDNVDPDVPEVEIPEENMEIAIQNLERVQEAMSPLFLASENAEELAQHLDEIKAMEGVEDAWVGEDAATLWIQIEKGGKVVYHYLPDITPPSDLSILVENLKSFQSFRKTVDNPICTNNNFCIINQVSNDERFIYAKIMINELETAYKCKNFTVKKINSEDFTLDFIKSELSNYGIIFLITHGVLDNNGKHWLLTGLQRNYLTAACTKLWHDDTVILDFSKERRFGEDVEIGYIAIGEEFLQHPDYLLNLPSNSILFNTACHSLENNPGLWNVLKNKKLGSYLGFDDINSIGVKAGVAFFENMLAGMTVSEAFNALPAGLKNEKGVHNNKNYDATLHCLPSDCQITLFDKPEITDEEAVDLGLSVKWGNKNLGASTYTNLGNSYEDYDYDYLYNNSPELFEWNGAELNLGKTKYDYAYTDLGENWRLPTTEEWMELRNNCKWEADIIDNTPGFRVKGPNGNSIFIPGKFHYEPEGGSYAFEANYFSSRMTSLGVCSIYIVGTKTIFGFNSTAVDEYWIEDTAFIRPVCD